MTKKAAQTASFMVRFTQKIYDESGESKVQWRGNISHVQGGEDYNFTDFNEAVSFIQKRLAELTIEATNDKTSEEQENILTKSFSLFKTMAASGPKILKNTLKDPRKQVAHLQDQLSEYGEDLFEKMPIDQWRNASKSDFHSMQGTLTALTAAVGALSKKVDALSDSVASVKTTKSTKTPVKKTIAASSEKPAAKKTATGAKTSVKKKTAASSKTTPTKKSAASANTPTKKK
ncbi:MAG: hypothetical protein WBG48_19790 [Pricia sp.]